MSCANCTRLGRPCVTSSVDRLDKVADDLASKIAKDEAIVSEKMEEMLRVMEQLQDARNRIARNKVVQKQNNRRLDEQLRHLVDNMPSADENAGFSQAVMLGQSLEGVGLADPFEWDFEPGFVGGTVAGGPDNS